MDTAARELVSFTTSLAHSDLNSHVLHQAKRRLIDTLGCAIGAYTAPPVKIARRVAPRVVEGNAARIIGSLLPTSLDMAAFVNGVMVRYLDFNDTYRTVDGSHPSDNLPALLAVAESEDTTGIDFLVALTIAYEIQCRFVDCVPLNSRGWDMPVSGAIATTLACGRLLACTEEQLHEALSIAASSNMCTNQRQVGEMFMWKGCAGANGARQGLFAAMLAKEGMTGVSEAFDGPFGFWQQTMGREYEIKGLARKGQKFGITQSNIKTYPVKDSLQLPVRTAVDLHGKVEPGQIKSVRAETYQSSYKSGAADKEYWAPKTRETADHSMPFCVAVGILDGAITPETFLHDRHLDDDVKELIAKSKVEVAEEFTKQAPAVRNCRITVTTHSGQTISSQHKMTFDDIERGPTDVELEEKFCGLTEQFLTRHQQRKLLNASWNLEQARNMRKFVDLLEI